MLFLIRDRNEILFVQAAGSADVDERAHKVVPQDEHRGVQGEARQPPNPDHQARLPQVRSLW